MALAFATFKKKMFSNYIKKDKELDWNDFPQLKPYWEDFKQYKLSEEAQEKSEQAKRNAGNKKYSHHLGAGGYKKAVKKWQKTEQDWIEASGRRLGNGRIDRSGGYLLTVCHSTQRMELWSSLGIWKKWPTIWSQQ